MKSEESRQKRDEDTNFSVEDLGLGLKDVLAQLDREQARVKLRLEMRRFSKPTTIIEGLKMSRRELQDLSSVMKRRLATGGTVKDGALLFQGDHRERAAKLLVGQGFSEDSIEVL